MGDVPARSAVIGRDAWSNLTSAVINDMLESGEDPSDTALYKERLAEAVAALRRQMLEAGQ